MKRRLLLQSGLMCLPLSALARGNLPQEYSDVIVVGGGSGGLTAALSCREYGLKVTLLEKMAFLGGDTLHSGGYFNAVTDEAVKRGEDSVELFKQQILKSAAGYADEDVVSVYAASCGAALEWLKSQGMKFFPVPHLVYGGLWGRSYKPLQPSGTGYVQVLSNACLRKGVDVRTSAAVTGLVTDDETGRVVGVRVTYRGELRLLFANRGVVLASGGFGANRQMLAQSSPLFADMGSDSHPGATGEMIYTASSVGAHLRNMEFIECVPGGIEESSEQVRLDYDPTVVMLVDENGNRFVEETSPRSEIFSAYRSKNIRRCFTIADSDAVERIGLARRKSLYRGLYSGRSWRCETLEALAEALQVNPDHLIASAAELQERGVLNKPPYWAVRVFFKIHTTLGGVVIDTKARVLGAHRAISGLYACGQMIGNLHGKNRLGGNGINSAVCFGRIAAESILKDS